MAWEVLNQRSQLFFAAKNDASPLGFVAMTDDVCYQSLA